MPNRLVPALAATLLLTPVSAQLVPRTFAIDPQHSSVTFKVPFMGLGSVSGEFQEFTGALLIGATPEQSSVTAVIRTRSISTHAKARDDHLRSPDFFAADSFPAITFQSTRIERRGGGWVAHGPFSMRGVTRVIALPFTQMHPLTTDAWGNSRITYHSALKVSRRDYNIRGTAFWNGEYDPGRFAVGDSVQIEMEISATIPNTAKWTIPKTDSLVQVAETAGVERLIAGLSSAESQGINDNMVFVSAYKLVQRKQLDAGVRLFEWGLDRYKDSRMLPMAAAILGDTQMQAGRRDAAIRSFRRALTADPEDPVALAWLRYLGEERMTR